MLAVAAGLAVALVLVGPADTRGQKKSGEGPPAPIYPSISLTATGGGSIKGHGEWEKAGLSYSKISMFAAPVDGGYLYKAVGLSAEPTGKRWPNADSLLISAPNGTYSVWAVLTLDDNGTAVYYSSTVATVVVNDSLTKEPELAGNSVMWKDGEPVAYDAAISGGGTMHPPTGQTVNVVQVFATPAAGGKFSEGGVTTDTAASPQTWTGSVANLTNGTNYGVVGILTLDSNTQYATKWVQRTPQKGP